MNQDNYSSDPPMGQDPLVLLKTLELLWTKQELGKLKEEIRRGFARLEDPLAGLLAMLESSSDWKGRGHSLGYCITTELQLWIKAHPAVPQSSTKLKKLQARVLGMLSQCPTNLLDPLISIYQLHTADRNYLLEHVSHLYLQGNYKEAAILSIKLKLQLDQDVEKMCTPLLLQDKANLVEEYVAEYPELQRKLLQTLDMWCNPSFNIRDITRPYQGLSKYKPEKFNHRVLSKLVFRLLERFNVDSALCPNVINQRHLRTLKYLFYKRFVEKTMTEENWADHIQSTVGDNRWLQEQLVQSLLRHCDARGAARWAQRCCVPPEMLPQAVAEELQKLHIQDRVEEVTKAGNYEASRKKDYYQLPIPRENIHFLQTWEEMLQCWEKVLQPGQVVGVDMEWKPSFGMVGKPRVALLQLALKDEVFLLDLPQLLEQAEAEGEKEKLPHFIQMLYSDATITKLGYGMSGDLSSLAATCSALKDTEKQMQGVVDLLAVDKQECQGPRTEPSRPPASISPQEFSVVCDNMLQGLGRYLRCLGVDVRLLDNEDDHRKAAEIARQEGRVILTSGLPYQTLRSQVGEGRCFSVNCSEKAKEQALQVLKHFNVQVSLGDIFSRCQVCNCNKYLKVSREGMKQLVESSKASGEHSAGCLGSQSCSVTVPDCDTAQPGCAPHSEQAEAMEQCRAAAVLAGDTVLQVTAIPLGVLDRAELTDFYCCTCCGKVFWEGSHFGRIVSQFQDVLVASGDTQSIYELS
ncbi:exonuclease mut-7 homolog isoform X5 [Vidua chalybeata]|uniref:exonuclease mut-7 homolog isoform X5 n=1 Tax=Vidua chalybeata TaxID=81927 RepID=UPI0023A8EAC0|nr:exonuclease mut-7 homolog isoform X5 [Vidua chalybeata]